MTQLSLARKAPPMLAQADALEWLGNFGDETADLVITDTAYESLEKHRARGTTTRLKQSKASSNKWFPIFPNAKFPALFREFYRVLKPNTHCYMYSDQETMFVAKPIAEAAGFKFWKALIWDKGPALGMGYHYRAQHELVLFFEKGKRPLASLSISDVLRFQPIRKGYPTEKNPGLARVLIEQSSAPGELVLDPFMGSGSTGFAALSCGRRFGGCDIDAEAFELTKARLATLTAQDSK